MKKDNLGYTLISSVAAYLDTIQKIAQSNDQDLFYRGQTQLGDDKGKEFIEWKPSPSIFRNERLSRENQFYSYVMTECANEFTACLNHCETLSKMQHYGVPTRLLDITSNALAALFFACVNEDGTDSRKDGVVYIIGSDKNHIKEYDSDTITILSSLPRFTLAAQTVIKQNAHDALCSASSIDAIADFNKNDNEQVQRLLHEIKKETPAFEPKINPAHLLDNFIFTPQKTHPRIIKQSGAFILFGLEDQSIPDNNNKESVPATEVESPNIKYKIKIPKEYKPKITKTLDQCGISLATMYPELYKVAEYLRNRKLFKK